MKPMPSACSDLSRRLCVRSADTMLVIGDAAFGRMGRGIVAAVVHRSAEGAFTHLYALPDAASRGRSEVRLLAVIRGEGLAEARSRAAALAGFLPLEAAAALAA